MTTDTKDFVTSPDQMLRRLADIQTAGLGSLSWLGTGWLDKMGELGAEWLHFVAERVQSDIDTQRALLNAKDLEEVQTIQAQFLQKALEDYQSETGKIVEICSDAAAGMAARAEKG